MKKQSITASFDVSIRRIKKKFNPLKLVGFEPTSWAELLILLQGDILEYKSGVVVTVAVMLHSKFDSLCIQTHPTCAFCRTCAQYKFGLFFCLQPNITQCCCPVCELDLFEIFGLWNFGFCFWNTSITSGPPSRLTAGQSIWRLDRGLSVYLFVFSLATQPVCDIETQTTT